MGTLSMMIYWIQICLETQQLIYLTYIDNDVILTVFGAKHVRHYIINSALFAIDKLRKQNQNILQI